MTIEGLQRLQDANVRMIAALEPRGALGEAVRYATAGAHRYAVYVTHVDTGALRASHRMQVVGVRGRVYLDPTGKNPRSRQRTAVYGLYEEARGGRHAFYRRTIEEAGPRLGREAVAIIIRGMP